ERVRLMETVFWPRVMYGSPVWATKQNKNKLMCLAKKTNNLAAQFTLGTFKSMPLSWNRGCSARCVNTIQEILVKRGFERYPWLGNHLPIVQDELDRLKGADPESILIRYASRQLRCGPDPILHHMELSKDLAVGATTELVLCIDSSPNSVAIFTDGSFDRERGGLGAAVCPALDLALTSALGIDPFFSNHECEAVGVLLAFKLRLLECNEEKSGQYIFLEILDVWNDIPVDLNLNLVWCPGHQGIVGNKLADRLAGECEQIGDGNQALNQSGNKEDIESEVINTPDRLQFPHKSTVVWEIPFTSTSLQGKKKIGPNLPILRRPGNHHSPHEFLPQIQRSPSAIEEECRTFLGGRVPQRLAKIFLSLMLKNSVYFYAITLFMFPFLTLLFSLFCFLFNSWLSCARIFWFLISSVLILFYYCRQKGVGDSYTTLYLVCRSSRPALIPHRVSQGSSPAPNTMLRAKLHLKKIKIKDHSPGDGLSARPVGKGMCWASSSNADAESGWDEAEMDTCLSACSGTLKREKMGKHVIQKRSHILNPSISRFSMHRSPPTHGCKLIDCLGLCPWAHAQHPLDHLLQHCRNTLVDNNLYVMPSSRTAGNPPGLSDLLRSRLRALLPFGLISIIGLSIYFFFRSVILDTGQEVLQQQHANFRIDGLGR
ncbi:uncharacterized protein VP01_4024g1, partial [Puccinia sorghi]